jgi:hypothetical protein
MAQTMTPASDAPATTIENGKITAAIYLPDPAKGYYRGMRFDWSGNMSSLTWKGHEYFGQWFEQYDPTLHDAIMGPVEEFLTGESALGYDEAKVGGTFVRIGVGVLRKPEEPAFKRFGTYEIVNNGKWTVTKGKDRITFVHELSDGAGYAYVYTKTLRLEGDSLVIDHELENTGSKRIATTVYNHNFFTLDRKVTGPDLVARFPFEAKGDRDLKGLLQIRGREISPLRAFTPGENVFTELAGYGTAASDYGFEMENRATGAGVRVTSDRPLAKFVFWSAVKTFCPEPYIDASVDPGKASTWRLTYAFYEATRAAASR